jgi:hypothetical protein
MLTQTQETVDLRELEALWALPARKVPRVTPQLAGDTSTRIVKTLAWAWPLLLFALLAFEPTPEPNAQVPVWGALLSTLLLLTVLAGVIARFASEPRVGLGLFSAAGAMGIAVGIGCRATAHHAGSWWAVETGLFSALALAAFAGLALARRAST